MRRLAALAVLALVVDASFALLAPPVSSATRDLRIDVQAPCRSLCTLSQPGEEPRQLLGRRALTRAAASALLLALPFSSPNLAAAEDCSYAALASLPAVLNKVNSLATGDPKVAEAGLTAEPLLAKSATLSAALDACSDDEKSKQETLKKYDLMRDELAFQSGKTYDPRWADPDDMADMQAATKA